MKEPFTPPTFVKTGLAGILLVGLIAACLHVLGRPTRAPEPPVRTTASQPVNLAARAPIKSAKRMQRPEVAEFRVLSIEKLPGRQTATRFSDLGATNWIHDTPPGTKLPYYQLQINPEDLTKLEQFPRSDDRHPATFVASASASLKRLLVMAPVSGTSVKSRMEASS